LTIEELERSAQAMSVTLLGQLEGFRVGAVGPVIISVFRRTATVERLALLERTQRELLATHPKLWALNIVIGDSLLQPPPEVRELSGRLQKQFDDTTQGSATVLAVKGLGAVIARGFLATLALISNGSKPTEVFKTVEEATRWLASQPGTPADLKDSSFGRDVEAFVAATS
jgi:hypothetical protein